MKIQVIVDEQGEIVSYSPIDSVQRNDVEGPSAAGIKLAHPEHTMYEMDAPDDLWNPSDDSRIQQLTKLIYTKLEAKEFLRVHPN